MCGIKEQYSLHRNTLPLQCSRDQDKALSIPFTTRRVKDASRTQGFPTLWRCSVLHLQELPAYCQHELSNLDLQSFLKR